MKPPLLPLVDAQEMLISSAQRLSVESIAVTQSLGRIVAHDILSNRDQPAANMSAMDGYAVKYDGATSWEVIGECRAGYPPCDEIAYGQAARIYTGALLPKGADTVIIQENIDANDNAVFLIEKTSIQQGQNIRSKGNDFRLGEIIIKAGTSVTPAMIGLIIAAGHAQISVHCKPQIAIISTGDELRNLGDPCENHQIPSSNGPMIAALLGGCDIVFNGFIGDDLDAINSCINDHKSCDIIVTIGGASVGDHDLILPALKTLTANINFMKVAIKPGKPIMTARLDQCHIIGLPGNPASTFVTAILFLLPLVRYISGASHYMPPIKRAQTTINLPKTGSRAEFLRAIERDGSITAFSAQDSSKLSTLAAANALIVRSSNAMRKQESHQVDYIAI